MTGCDFSGEVSYHRWRLAPYSRYVLAVSRSSNLGDSRNFFCCASTDLSGGGCGAPAASGHPTAAPPSSVMNLRRFIAAVIRSPRRRGSLGIGFDVVLFDHRTPELHLVCQKLALRF